MEHAEVSLSSQQGQCQRRVWGVHSGWDGTPENWMDSVEVTDETLRGLGQAIALRSCEAERQFADSSYAEIAGSGGFCVAPWPTARGLKAATKI